MKTNVDIIESAGGNVGSICRAFERLGVEYRKVNEQRPPDGSRPVVLPGVGAFGAVMSRLKERELDKTITKLVDDGVSFLGVCVGLQVLFEESEESPGMSGLGILPGRIVRFQQGKVPQIGWNYVESESGDWDAGYAYFVNSFYAEPAAPDVVLYRSKYYEPFCAAVKKKNVTAFQFHPEKSGSFGMTLLQKWVNNGGN